MKFENPHILFGLILLIPASIWIYRLSGRKWKLLNQFASKDIIIKLGFYHSDYTVIIRSFLIILALGLMIISLARPQWGYEDRRVVSRGVDVIVAVDASASMMAQDYKPTRLGRAKELLQNIIYEVKGDRIGVIAFAGSSAVLCPLTLDYRMAETALQTVNPTVIERQGTDIGDAVEMAVSAFDMSNAGEKILVLLTDGEDQGNQLDTSIANAKKANIKIFTIGIGTTEGSNIPQAGGYKRDKSGNVVKTILNYDALEKIAASTGGTAIKAQESGLSELKPIISDLRNAKGVEKQDQIYRVYKDRFIWFLFPAVLLLCAEMFLNSSISRRLVFNSKYMLVFATAILFPSLSFSWPGEAQWKSKEAEQNFSLKEYEKAEKLYKEVNKTEKENPISTYNLATAEAMNGNTDDARNKFLSVFDPKRNDINSKSLYNASTLLHKTIRKDITEKLPEWEAAANDGQTSDDTVKSIDDTLGKLKDVIDEYKQAILSNETDKDFKHNYELASADKRKLEELKQQIESKKNQDKQSNQEKQDNNDNKQDSQGQKDDKDKQSENSKSDKQDKKDQQNDDQNKNDQDKSQENQNGKQGNDGKSSNDSEGQNNHPSDKNGDKEKENQQSPKGTPTPTPSPTPSENNSETNQPQPSDKDGKGKDGKPVPVGEMSKADVDRLLNTLPGEDAKALQRMYQTPQREYPMEKDW